MTPVDEVIAKLLSMANTTKQVERLDLTDALDRMLAEDIIASVDVPMAANSAMDGYALDASDLQMQAGGLYPVVGRIAAGYVGQPLQPGTLSRIFTGAPLPVGANAVVIQEDTELESGLVRIKTMPSPGENVRPQGQDVIKGQTVMTAGRRLLPQDLGLIASVGVSRVAVYEPLVIGLMSTGDELVEPPEPLGPGKIYNSNHFTLAGLIRRLGMQVYDLGLVADTPEATERALLKGAANADCIISSGGVSVGEEDHVRAAVERLGRLDLWRIAIKPGKPMAFGQVAGVPFIGLPGNPVSSFVTFMMIARPYLLSCQGCTETTLFSLYARAGFASKAGNRREYWRVQLAPGSMGEMTVTRHPRQGSGVMSSVSWANALAEQDIGQDIAEGDWLKVYPIAF